MGGERSGGKVVQCLIGDTEGDSGLNLLQSLNEVAVTEEGEEDDVCLLPEGGD